MPNPIKYSTGSESNALKKGNLYIGTGDVGKGPSDVTGFYQGVSPSAGGYVIYMNKSGAPGGLSYHNAPTDAELISFTNNLAGESYTTVNECLVYYAGQSDKVCLNRDYEGIVTDGLVLNLDAGFTPSYPRNGTTWYSVGYSGNTGTLRNGITFSADAFSFDGSDDHVKVPFTTFPIQGPGTIVFTGSYSSLSPYRNAITLGNGTGGSNSSAIQVGVIYDVGYVWKAGGGTLLTYTTPQTGVTYQWAITFSGSNISVYINGVLDSQTNEALFQTGNSNNFWIGTYRDSGAEAFAGSIYNCCLYNKVLSDNEITQNYNAQKGRFGL